MTLLSNMKFRGKFLTITAMTPLTFAREYPADTFVHWERQSDGGIYWRLFGIECSWW